MLVAEVVAVVEPVATTELAKGLREVVIEEIPTAELGDGEGPNVTAAVVELGEGDAAAEETVPSKELVAGVVPAVEETIGVGLTAIDDCTVIEEVVVVDNGPLASLAPLTPACAVMAPMVAFK
jgi:hypothetical protein